MAEVQERCELCLNFDADDQQRQILKKLTASNPGNQAFYEQIAEMVGGGASSSQMGTCYLTKVRVSEKDVCDEFVSDIS